jgi:hypothetical protein
LKNKPATKYLIARFSPQISLADLPLELQKKSVAQFLQLQ